MYVLMKKLEFKSIGPTIMECLTPLHNVTLKDHKNGETVLVVVDGVTLPTCYSNSIDRGLIMQMAAKMIARHYGYEVFRRLDY